jgi:hypothetical protein
MKLLRNTILPVLLATIWISLSEFVRNQYVVNTYWTNHYKSMGLVFPSSPANGAVWGIWSLFFAVAIFIFSRKYNLVQTTLIGWFVGFVLMWIAIGNLGFLPFGILPFAIPLSLLESFIAALIIRKLTR